MAILNPIIAFGNWFWGVPILFLIVGGGLYMGLRIGFIQFRRFGYMMSQTFGKMFEKDPSKEISPFAAACTALASTIGASNIVGVPVAIALGGPGAVFWIWLIALIGCGTKYVEVALGVAYREKNEAGEWVGGPFYYCRGWGGPVGKFFGYFYAVGLMIELIPSLASQTLSATDQFGIFGVPQLVSGIIIAALTVIIILGGFKRIANTMNILVPIMAAVYLVGALVVIIVNIGNLVPALGSIFAYAFAPHAAVGGFAGSTFALTLRWGAARGVYSNEAGFGTAPAAHSSADVDHPIRQACWGVFEVTVDTLVVCTTTALMVLATGVWTTTEYESGALAQAAFATVFGNFGNYFVAICVFLFVFSTLVSCVYYGQRQAEFLFGVKFSNVWKFIYPIFFIIAASGMDLTTMYMITDGMLGLIMIPNVITCIILVPQVKKLQDEYFNTPDKYFLADKAAKAAKKAAKA